MNEIEVNWLGRDTKNLFRNQLFCLQLLIKLDAETNSRILKLHIQVGFEMVPFTPSLWRTLLKDTILMGAQRGGADSKTQYKWNPFEKLMIPSNLVQLINYELNKKLWKKFIQSYWKESLKTQDLWVHLPLDIPMTL